MKKIYVSVISVLFSFIMLVMAILWCTDKNGNVFLGYLSVIVMLVMFIFSLYFSFIPLMTYDENGLLKKTLVTKYKEKHLWRNARSITASSTSNTATINFTDSKNKYHDTIVLTSFMTRKYFEVLSDIVKYIQKENPHAKIDKLVLERIKKPPMFYW